MYPSHNDYPVAKRVENLYQGRIRQFNDPNGQYRDLNLPHFFDRARTDSGENVRLLAFDVPNLERPSFKDAMAMAEGNWREVSKGNFFGPIWSTHWFHVEVRIPTDWAQFKEGANFDFDSSCEGMLYTEEGTPLQGLSGEHRRTEFALPTEWIGDDEWHVFYIEISCNDVSGNGSPPDPNRQFRLNRADLVVPNQGARALNIDFWLLGDCAREFPAGSWQRGKALDLLNTVINTFDRNNPDESISECRKLTAQYLGDVNSSNVYKKGNKSIMPQNRVWAIGNCHIDTAWLWPFAETRRKIARSWASQLDLLERYDEYVFAASQAVQFQWLEEDHPHLFARVKSAVKDGRFIPIGGSWVECDTNMPSGESLSRQMILGQKFFGKKFGVRSKVFWLPDTFGYAPQLPQICRLAGQPYFVTQKLSWNNIDVFPLSTFSWVGLDGSQVLCHMPPANTYTAEANFGDIKRTIEQHKNLDTSRDAMMLFGYGDGGGGPTAEMLEKMRRCRGIANESELLPGTLSGKQYTPETFFENIIASSNNGKSLPTWKGELYLEYHRGTYTTQAAIKKGNRRCEALMFDAEKYATLASLKVPDYNYPHTELEELWKLVCLDQFHDVLPGSGIEIIYDDARRIHAEVQEKARKIIRSAVHKLKRVEGALSRPPKEENGYLQDIKRALSCVEADATAKADAEEDEEEPLNDDDIVYPSKNYEVRFTNGELVSIWDKVSERYVNVEGAISNQMLLLEDQPLNFPAWDTEQYATEKIQRLKPVKWKAAKSCFQVWYEFGSSKIHQVITVHPNFINFDTSVDWHETYQFLKVEFPVDIQSDFASYETSFGVQRRPTHFNTSWDAAKFEVCGHRFADLSQFDYGVSLINDCKYGYSIHGKSMRLSLLRSPKSPDANADMGKHRFKYALFPHDGSLSEGTLRMAQCYNRPIYEATTKDKVEHFFYDSDFIQLCSEQTNSMAISAIKRADADSRNRKKRRVVVRIYEALGGRGKGELKCKFDVSSARRVNLLEDPEFEEDELEAESELDVISTQEYEHIPITLKPFEVATILLECP